MIYKLERAMGIEPTFVAWEATVLPLYDARFWVVQYHRGSVVGSREGAKTRLWALRMVGCGQARRCLRKWVRCGLVGAILIRLKTR